MAPAARIFSCSAGDLTTRTQLTSSRESTRAAWRRWLRRARKPRAEKKCASRLGGDLHPGGVLDHAELQGPVGDPVEGVHVRAVHEVFGIPVDVVAAEVGRVVSALGVHRPREQVGQARGGHHQALGV